ncbi:hypothetical protein [Pseudomonas sp.]|uniref:hypothetical protein n=1 Tax=Pseudomonas sp. TaxID=306 RepID=UPI002585C466|nr:hypothetical protein [Pseudomonas sp.]
MTELVPELEIISRKEAMARGMKFYFTGKACSRGGIAKRFVSNGDCQCEKCKGRSSERGKNWHSKNRNAILERQALYRQDNREQLAEKQRNDRAANPEKSRKWALSYREKHRDKEIERKRKYREENGDKISAYSKRYREENKEKATESCRQYGIRNKAKRAARKAKRRAAKRQAVPSWVGEFDQFVIEEAYALAKQREAETAFEWHVDHMIPLQARKACGLHCADNIQVIPAEMNLIKRNNMMFTRPLEWLREWASNHLSITLIIA